MSRAESKGAAAAEQGGSDRTPGLQVARQACRRSSCKRSKAVRRRVLKEKPHLLCLEPHIVRQVVKFWPREQGLNDIIWG